jgi:hypothetical protein
LYRATFEFGIYNGDADGKDAALSMRATEHGCDFLFRCDVDYLLAYGNAVPRFYDAGLRYKSPEDACGGDIWQDIPTLLGRRYGDCKDLSCFRAADLVVRQKVDARPIVKRRFYPSGFALYHVVVLLPNGDIEDPSKILGMDPASFG